MKRPQRRRSKQQHPTVELELRLPASRRHRQGAARCQAITRRDGEPRQCRRKARDGFPVCSHHGAGSRKRELAGISKNPALVRLTTGKRAKLSTLELLVQQRPGFRFSCEKNWDDNDVLDMQPLLARTRGITESLLSHADSCHGAEAQASAVIAIQALSHLMRALRNMLRIEERFAPITHADMTMVMRAIWTTIKQFVPEDRCSDAVAVLRQELIGEDQPQLMLTAQDVSSWTDEMLEALLREDMPLGLVLLVGAPPPTRRDSRRLDLPGYARRPAPVPATIGARAEHSIPGLPVQHGPPAQSISEKNRKLLDLRPVLAQATAVAERLAARIDARDGVKALSILKSSSDVIRAAGDILRIEERLGSVLHADMRRLMSTFSNIIELFVSEGQRANAHQFFQETLSPFSGGWWNRPSP